ncbi:MAG: hypothetical protein QXN23_05585 [Candidatus Caldarchaeum sp.]|uniref:Thaumarchaeal output domain-containing protein n=1 Tax=Caldiarchaeum subterraneum TaxID=311458 RepID=A0A7C4E073_CALS0|nr:transposase [Candidatus Caldarchaeales archaeon]
MSLVDFSAVEYEVLAWLNFLKQGSEHGVKLFDIDVKTGEVKIVADPPMKLELSELVKVLEKLESRGLVKSFFEKKIALCSRCGKGIFQTHLNCVSCGSENIDKVMVYVHNCGASIPETLLASVKTCPKCGDVLEKKDFVASHGRFVCNNCGEVFEHPEVLAECVSCGYSSKATENVYLTLRRYMVTDSGALLVEVRSPLRVLLRNLLEQGFKVSENVSLRGVSGASHQVSLVAARLDETRIYEVGYFVDAETLLRFAVKRLDVEKTSIPGALGRVRWIMAGVEFAEPALKTAETFGVEVEVVKVD